MPSVDLSALGEALGYLGDGAVLISRPAAGIRWANATAAAIVGYSPDGFEVPSFLAFVAPDQRGDLAQRIAKGGHDRSERPFPASLVHRSGAQVDVEIALLPQQDDALLLIKHARSRSPAPSQLREAERALTAALAARDEFLSIASHDLRGPIATLHMLVDHTARVSERSFAEVTPEWLAERLGQLRRQAQRMNQSVLALLDVSRMTAGPLDLNVEPVDLAALVREAVQRFEEPAEQQGCALSLRCAGEIVGAWDRTRLDQVVSNLLSNAVKYGAGGPIEIELSSDGERARLVVRDRGIGIAAEDHARIFDRFERAAPGKEYSGMGLGLWIVAEVVARLGGAVRVESALGAGAAFTVELPL